MEEMTNEAVVETKGGKRLAEGTGKRRESGRRPLVIVGAVLAVVLAAYVGLCAYASQLDTMFPGMQVNRTPVGGMTIAEAEGQLTEVGLAVSDRTFSLYLTESEGSQMLVCEPFDVSYADLGGVEIDPARTAQRAYDYCHEKNFFQTGWRYLECLLGKGGVFAVNTAPNLPALAGELAEKYAQPAVDASYVLTDSGISVTAARDGYLIDPEVLAESIQLQLADGGYPISMDCPTAHAAGKTLTAQEIHDEVAAEMKNAGYDAATDTIIPEQLGAEFDVGAAQAVLDKAAPGETVEIDAVIERPAVTAEELKAVLFRDVLGECTTHVGGSAGRISNVKLSASAFNGLVMNSGDMISYNETTGQRTVAKGYQPAPAYVKGETVDEIGGGVCQTSSTLYLACLRANLEITERYAHRYVPAYIPWGMDATVSWGGPDYKFTNNTDYPIKLVTSYAKGYLTIKILGTNADGTTVKITNETLSTTPSQVVYEDDPTLAPGTEKVKTTPYTGYKVKTYRHVYGADGRLISSAFEASSDYKVRNKVILRGPAKAAEPGVPAGGGADIPAETPGTTTPAEPVTPPVEPETPVTPTAPEEGPPSFVVLPEEPEA